MVATLPLNGTLGLQAFVTDGTTKNTSCMGYFYQGKWYRVSDNSLMKDNTVDLFIIAGQSNSHGWADVGSLDVSRRFILYLVA